MPCILLILTNSPLLLGGVSDHDRAWITEYLASSSLSVWHWFADAWIAIVDVPPGMTDADQVKVFHDRLYEYIAPKHVIVIHLPQRCALYGTLPVEAVEWLTKNVMVGTSVVNLR